MSAAKVAVVIPVGSVDDAFAAHVRNVLDQSCGQPFEVMLSINTSDEDVVNAIDRLVEQVGDRRLATVDSSDRSGAAHARNVGIRNTHAQLVAFCDADDRVHDGWLSALMNGLEQHDAVSGRVIDVFPDQRTASWHPPATPGDLPKFLGQKYLLTGNLAVRRSAFDAVGGFDESLTRCEDIAFGWSLVRAGYSIGYAEFAVIDYVHRSGLRPMLRQHFQYGRGMAEVLSRYGVPSGDAWQPANGLRSLKPNGQRAQRRTVGGTLRRAALAAGRISGIASRHTRRLKYPNRGRDDV